MRHAVVTGGGTGIGRSIALRLVRGGWRVTVMGRRRGPLEAVAEAAGADAGEAPIAAEPADVTDAAGLREAFARAAARFGPPAAVIANAGAAESAPVAKVSLELWRRTLDVNLTGAFLTAQTGLPSMLEQGWGRLVFVASTAGLKGYAYVSPYCAAKHGVVGLARSLALEVAKKGVTVNAVCPGYVETELLDATLDNIRSKTGMSEEEARRALTRSNPQGRFVTPQEVAEAVAFLVEDEAAAITGQAISISGGEV